MNKVLAFLSVLLFALKATHVASDAACPAAVGSTTTSFVPACAAGDVYVKWPVYSDPNSFYQCQGMGNPVVVPCPAGQYFSYVLQSCGPCANYIPPVECSKLPTQSPPKCTTVTTTAAPVTTTTKATPAPVTTTTAAPVTTTTKTTVTVPTPAVVTTTPSGIPSPPTPANPDVPMPPTPAPTPPKVDVTPPNAPDTILG